MKPPQFMPQVIYRKRLLTAHAAPAIAPAREVAGVAGVAGFPGRLRWLRTQAGISQREQDRYAGLIEGHSANIESGRKSDALGAKFVARLSRVYGATMDWLFLGVGEPPNARDIETAVDIADGRLRDVSDAVAEAREKLRVL